MKRLVLTAALLLMVAPSLADYEPRKSAQGGFELGASLGVPALVGIQIGYWGPQSVPLLVRASVGLGTTVDLGVHLPINENPDNRLYLAVSGGAVGYFRVLSDTSYSIGPIIGARIGHFFAQIGPGIYIRNYYSTSFAVQGQLGWSVFY